MPDRILTSHAGSLPRPEDLIALNGGRSGGELPDEDGYLGSLRAAVADVVARQRGIGIDLVKRRRVRALNGHSSLINYCSAQWPVGGLDDLHPSLNPGAPAPRRQRTRT